MGTVIMNGPPDCPNGDWCVSCLMDAKQRQWEQYQDEIQKGHEASGEKKTVIPWPAGLTKALFVGEYRAVAGDYPQMGMVDPLCWTHVAGINPSKTEESPSPIVPVPGPLPPSALRRR